MKNSKRQFQLFSSTELTQRVYDLEDLSNDDGSEILYALQEIIDEILDLKRGESMYFQPNRDNKESKGVIVRID